MIKIGKTACVEQKLDHFMMKEVNWSPTETEKSTETRWLEGKKVCGHAPGEPSVAVTSLSSLQEPLPIGRDSYFRLDRCLVFTAWERKSDKTHLDHNKNMKKY